MPTARFFKLSMRQRPILHYRTKFRKDWSNLCGYIAMYVILKTAAAILDFHKFYISPVDPLLEPCC